MDYNDEIVSVLRICLQIWEASSEYGQFFTVLHLGDFNDKRLINLQFIKQCTKRSVKILNRTIFLAMDEEVLIDFIDTGNVFLIPISTSQCVPHFICRCEHHHTPSNTIIHVVHQPRDHFTIIREPIFICSIFHIERIMSYTTNLLMYTNEGLNSLRLQ